MIGVRAGQCRDQAILELAPVDEPGQRVVRRLVGKLAEEARFLADVVEHHHRADDVADAVADRRGRILDRNLVAVLRDQHRV
ncbi:MAG: hypothetical protein ACRES3_05280, partial [Steroidobacteraceae bacterium]